MLAQSVERDTGLATRTLESLGSTVAFDALVAGQIDAYVDYSGTLWSTVLHHAEPRPDRQVLLSQVRDELAASTACAWWLRWALKTPTPWRCVAPMLIGWVCVGSASLPPRQPPAHRCRL